MPGGSFFALFDDIASVLDDVALLTKVATKKTAGVLGDDLALNAEQVSGVKADRELPVVWAVAKGSFINKVILIPVALFLSAAAPWLITPLMMIGGAFLCYEGFEKLAHKFLHTEAEDEAHHAELIHAITDENVDMLIFEKDKIKGAIRTDFILSGEIIIITLGTVASESFTKQLGVLTSIGVIMTIGVYGLVALIVKLDDLGFYLKKEQILNSVGQFKHTLGNGLLAFAPRLMKGLTFIGTAAMFLVGGGILSHSVPLLHDVSSAISMYVSSIAVVGAALEMLSPSLFDAVVGVVAGALVLVGMMGINKVIQSSKNN